MGYAKLLSKETDIVTKRQKTVWEGNEAVISFHKSMVH